jgi:hypothetical protein
MNPYRSGKLVLFQVTYDRDWHFFEIMFFVILGIFGVSVIILDHWKIPDPSMIGALWSVHGQVQSSMDGIPSQTPRKLSSD